MAQMLVIRRQPFAEFFFRRASRILPTLFVFATCMMIISLGTTIFDTPQINLKSYIATLFFFQNYLAAPNVSLLFEHCWSLAVEEHSYLLLAAIAALTIRDRRTVMAVAVLLAAAAVLNGWRLTGEPLGDAQSIYRRSDVRSASILMSFAAYLWVEARSLPVRRELWGAVSPLGLCMGMAILIHPATPDPIRFSFGTFLLAASVATLDLAPAPFRRLFELRALTLLGLISYSLYLWQQPFFHLTQTNVPTFLGFLLAMAGGVLSFRTIEQPLRRALNSWYSKRPGKMVREAPSATA
jgi:peptidoglycan/LPS O-acetylase OafA/YrhL